MKPGNESAYPIVCSDVGGETINVDEGLSKRELMAAMAMQGILSAIYSNKEMLTEFCKVKYVPRPQGIGESEHITGCEAVSANAVHYADALIAELNKEDSDG